MYEQIGQLTRKMHDALRDLGYDKSLGKVADAIPDAKDRWAISPP
jgi:chemotaxis protein CheZ